MADRRETFERVLAPEPGRTALVVVDMQRGFLDPGEAMEVPPAREIVPVIPRAPRPLPGQGSPGGVQRVRVLRERAGPHRNPPPRAPARAAGSAARHRASLLRV